MVKIESEKYQQLINSEEFMLLYRHLSHSNLRFQELPEKEKKIALAITMMGEEHIVNGLRETMFYRPVPSIEEMLTNRKYLGSVGQTIFSYWKEQLSKLFDPGLNYYEGVYSGAIGCVTGDTRIPLLDGRTMTIKEMAESGESEFWVYAYDIHKDDWTAALANNCHMSGRNVEVYRVEFTDGTYVDCTWDHPFLSTEGVYIRAIDLMPGDCIESLYTRISNTKFYSGYRVFGKDTPVHRHIASNVYGDLSNKQVHHLNHNKLDNRPNNLLPLSAKEHLTEHAIKYWQQQGVRELRSKAVSDRVREWQSSLMLDKKYSYEKWIASGKRQEFVKNTIEFNSTRHPRLRKDITLEAIVNKAIELNDSSTGYIVKALKCSRYKVNSVLLENDIRTTKEFSQKYNLRYRGNHEVKSVQLLQDKQDVYDITVPGYNNYAIEDQKGGYLFTHNTGKSSIARLSLLLNLIRLTCLKYPQLTLGQSEETILATQMMSINMDKAWLTLMEPIKALMRNSEYFEDVEKLVNLNNYVGDKVPYCRDGNYIRLRNNIIMMYGSTEAHALGMTLFGAMLDESEFRSGGVEMTFDLYTQLKERVRSRMLDQNTGLVPKYVMMALVSSAKTQNGVIYNYTRNIPVDDPHTRIMGGAIWEVKDTDSFKNGHFYVLRGSNNHPSQILDREYEDIESNSYVPPTNCKVVKVPAHYRRDFESRIEKALQNLAGEQTIGDDMPFNDLEHIEDESLLPEVNIIAPLGSRIKLVDKLPSKLFQSTVSGKILARYPNALRYCSVDLAERSTSQAGFTILHKELNDRHETIYVVDLIAWITSPTRIDLEAIKALIEDLATSCSVSFHTISFDQFQSSSTRQYLEVKKIAKEIKYVSVDRSAEAYEGLASTISAGLLKIGTCSKLKEQLENISIVNDKPTTRIRKDMADTLAAAVQNAKNNVMDVSGYYFSHYKHFDQEEALNSDEYEEL